MKVEEYLNLRSSEQNESATNVCLYEVHISDTQSSRPHCLSTVKSENVAKLYRQ